jgi:uncharacterized membrane protein
MKSNSEITSAARAALDGKWGLAVGTFFVYMLLVGSFSSGFTMGYWHDLTTCFSHGYGGFGHFGGLHATSGFLTLIIGGPLVLGAMTFALNIARNEDARFEDLFSGFKNFGKAIATYLLVVVFTFLWTLLLIIPGIIAAISYSQTFFILSDNPDIGAMEAIDKSKEMMYGYKWKYFCLCLRFVGWSILCVFTLGIGFFWLLPYVYVSYAKFYEEVKANDIPRELR